MKFTPTIMAVVTSLAFTNTVFSTPLTSKADSIDLISGNTVIGGVEAFNKVSKYSMTGAESNLSKRQSQKQLQAIIRDMDSVISNLGATDRADFTKKLIDQLFKYNGLYNYVVCHVKHDYDFTGTEGVDWAHYKTTFDKYQYDIVIGNAGIFTRYGDGGPTNWGYSTAYVKSATTFHDTETVVFLESF